MSQSEHDIQKAFFQWLHYQKFDGVELFHAIPNGGARHPAVGAKLKAEGVKAGALDTQWPVARGGFIGLAIEFKVPDGNPSKEQRDRMDKLQREGWCVALCWNWEAAARFVQGYAGLLKVVI
tara:strand:+ start:2308 stop:2673 length:366 start_codon:yes stop_codon:yes gene_type:complete